MKHLEHLQTIRRLFVEIVCERKHLHSVTKITTTTRKKDANKQKKNMSKNYKNNKKK